MSSPWTGTLWRGLGVLAMAAAFGLSLDQLGPALWIGTLVLLGWHGYQLYRFERWLRDDRRYPPPEAEGIWAEVYFHLRRRQRQYRQSRRRMAGVLKQFQAAAAAVPDAVVVLGEQDNVLWCNGAAETLLGLRLGQDSGQRITHLLRYPAFVRLLSEGQDPRGLEFPSPVDGARILSLRIVPYGQDQRLLLATDITRVRNLEKVRRDFVSNVSHELRTPLTVIRGYLETLLDSDAAIEPVRGPLWEMHKQTLRMQQIIEDLLMLSRLENDSERRPPQPVRVSALLESIVEDARVLGEGRHQRIDLKMEDRLDMLGHEQELRSAFSNLVFNAVRYTPDEGRIEIRWYADAKALHLEVQDNGEGIAAQHIPRLTERFYRVDRGRQRESGGTGLGLAIVKHVVERHRGHLDIRSRLGEGSTFSCAFPLEQKLAHASTSPTAF